MANEHVFMDALEAVAGAQASAYVTIEGKRYCLL